MLACAVVLATCNAAFAAGTTTSSGSTTETTPTQTTRTETRTNTATKTSTVTHSATKTRTVTQSPSTSTTAVTNAIVGNQTTNLHGSQQDSGVPAWAWVLIGLGVIAVVLLAVLTARGRRRRPPPGSTGMPGAPGESPDPPGRQPSSDP
jgi:cobalamin biosynthesis Mg chelatase CobN